MSVAAFSRSIANHVNSFAFQLMIMKTPIVKLVAVISLVLIHMSSTDDVLLAMAPVSGTSDPDASFNLLQDIVPGLSSEDFNKAEQSRNGHGPAVAASRLSLNYRGSDITELFSLITKQSGNEFTDFRQRMGQSTESQPLHIEMNEKEFWPAVDEILDQARLDLYPFASRDSLAVVNRPPEGADRSGNAAYAGPFRIEAVNVVTRRGLRNPAHSATHVELEIAWEPRLRPIALLLPCAQLVAMANDGSLVPMDRPDVVLNIEVPPGSHATEIRVPLKLPPRKLTHLTSIEGNLTAVLPGPIRDFRFTDVANAQQKAETHGDIKVRVERVRKNHDLWEIQFRVQINREESLLPSHLGWVLQNETFLVNDQGEQLEHMGFETLMQSSREVGLKYYFDVPDGEIGNYTWVYRSPEAILEVPIEFELKNVPLP